MTAYNIRPVTVKAAQQWVKAHHRHLPNIQGGLFAASVYLGDVMVGVAVAGNPARVWQGTGRIAISRCATLPDLPGHDGHAAPACTMLYGALCRAAKALGYGEAWTYSLEHEDGRSIKAAGFQYQGLSPSSETWKVSRNGRLPVETGRKGRWMRRLNQIGPETARQRCPALTTTKGNS